MPELPEVEVVRAGLAPAVAGASVVAVETRDHRALKRHVPRTGNGRSSHGVTLSPEDGRSRAADLERRLTGAVLGMPVRRGKFMWIPVDPSPEGRRFDDGAHASEALLAHLGMSGQLLLRKLDAPDDRHVRIRVWIDHPKHGELRLDFADQRLFGSLALDELVPTSDGAPGGFSGLGMLTAETVRRLTGSDAGTEIVGDQAAGSALIPSQATHIARDPLDPNFDDAVFVATLRATKTAVKSVLLDQRIVSGIGNIYADEALWAARIHGATPGARIGVRTARALLAELREVFAGALSEGGTSFDAQYVNVNGESGYFAHSLNAYGREGEPCRRCGESIRRVPFAGRSSHFCPRCQRKRL